eukprot:3045471-Rhodomonas_salina.2
MGAEGEGHHLQVWSELYESVVPTNQPLTDSVEGPRTIAKIKAFALRYIETNVVQVSHLSLRMRRLRPERFLILSAAALPGVLHRRRPLHAGDRAAVGEPCLLWLLQLQHGQHLGDAFDGCPSVLRRAARGPPSVSGPPQARRDRRRKHLGVPDPGTTGRDDAGPRHRRQQGQEFENGDRDQNEAVFDARVDLLDSPAPSETEDASDLRQRPAKGVGGGRG